MAISIKKVLARIWLVLLVGVFINPLDISTQAAESLNAMKLTIQTTQDNQTVSFPIYGTVDNISVNWGEPGSSITGPTSTAGLITHVYALPGTYDVIISGKSFTQFGYGAPYTGVETIVSVSTFGTLGIKSLYGAFYGATSLTTLPNSLPAGVTNLKRMLKGATAFNQSVDTWDTSAVTDMSEMFSGASYFNRNVSSWNTSLVTDFSAMFSGATSFNNGESSNFATSPLTTTSVVKWSTAKATNLASMFSGATNFNQSVSNWDVSRVTDFRSMFSGASSFKQAISAWKLNSSTNLTNFFHGGSWPTRTYDAILIAWAANSTIARNQSFDAGNSKYSSASNAARATLSGSASGQRSWAISDGGLQTIKVERTLTWQTRPDDAITFGSSTPPLLAVDSEGSKTVIYSVAPTSSAICSVGSSSGVVTQLYIGDCTYTATIAEDSYALAGSVTTTTVIKPPKPSEPRFVNTSVSGRDITVTWTAPVTNGIVGIDTYTATATAGAETYSCTATSPVRTCTIIGVSRGYNGYTYSVQVTATAKSFRTDPGLTSYPSIAAPAAVEAPLSRSVIWSPTLPSEVAFGPVGAISASDSLAVGAPIYSIVPGSERVCSVNPTSGALTLNRAGMCHYAATIASDPDRREAYSEGLLKVRPFSPGPPTNLSTNVDGRNIVVTFDAPADDGGYDLGRYVFRATNGSDTYTCETPATQQSCTFVGLTRGETGFTYTIKGFTQGADYDGKPGFTSADSQQATAYIAAPLVTHLTWDSEPPSSVDFGPQQKLIATEASGLGIIEYLVDVTSKDVCSVDSASGQLTALQAGTCKYEARILRTPDLFGDEITGEFEIAAVAPSVPRNVSLDVQGRNVTVRWAAPQSNGGVALESYQADLVGLGRTYTCTVIATANSCTVFGVSRGDDGVNYSVTVRVQNGSHNGAPGIWSDSTSPILAVVEAPGIRNLSWLNKPADQEYFGEVNALAAAGDVADVAPVYKILIGEDSVCSVDRNTGILTVLHAGNCTYQIDFAAGPDFKAGQITGSTLIKPVAPDSPRNVSASVNGREIIVNWQAPSSDGGNGIDGYWVRLTSSVKSYDCYATWPATSCTIFAVTRGTSGVTYKATVVALGTPFSPDPALTSKESESVDANVAAPLDSVVSWKTSPGSREDFGALTPLSVIGNLQDSAPQYLIDSSSSTVCSVERSTGNLTALRAGTCNYRVDIAADPDHSASSLTGSVLIMAVAPSQPVDLASQVIGRRVKISWSAPLQDGGNGITGYQVRLVSEDQTYTCDAVQTVFTCEFRDVSRGVAGYAYQAQVRAVGASFNGSSPLLSTWSLSVIAQVDEPRSRNLTWSSQPSAVENFGDLPSLSVDGLVAGADVTYSVATESNQVCKVNQNSGKLEALAVGECTYSASEPSDPDHKSATITDKVLIKPVAPGEPQGLTVSVDGRTLNISWQAPDEDGGNGIVGYKVLVYGGSQVLGCDTVVGVTSCQLTNLERGDNGTSYLVAVKAVGQAFMTDPPLMSKLSSAVEAFVEPPASRNLYWSTRPSDVTTFGTLPNLSLGGDTSGLLPYFSVEEPSKEVCDVDPVAGSITPIRAGVCAYAASLPGDGDFKPKVISAETIIAPGPPDAPSGFTADLTGQSLVANWAAPAFDGGSALKAYVVTASSPSGKLSCTALVPATTCNINGLQLGNSYSVSVKALNEDIPQAKGAYSAASNAVRLDLPAPPPVSTPTPSDSPTPSPTPSPEPTPTPDPTPAGANAGIGATGDDNSPPQAFDPLGSPAAVQAVAATTTKAVTLVSAVAAAAGAAAAGAAAAGAAGAGAAGAGSSAGSAGSGSSGGASGSSNSGSSGSQNNVNVGDMEQMEIRQDDLTLEDVGVGDGIAFTGARWFTILDKPSHELSEKSPIVSPLMAKVFNDAAYLKAIFGSFSLVLPLLGLWLGFASIGSDAFGVLTPNWFLMLLIAVLGIFDAFSGFLAGLVFVIGSAITATHPLDFSDLRLLAGVLLLCMGPSILSTTFRKLRKPAARNFSSWWERLADFAIAPFMASWIIGSMVSSMPALGGVTLPIANHVADFSIVTAIAIFVRVWVEEAAARYFPSRLNAINPDEVFEPPLVQRYVSLGLKFVLWVFVSGALIGFTWHVFVGAFLTLAPTIATWYEDRLPNSPTLWKLLPTGIPGLALKLSIASATTLIASQVLGSSPQLAAMSFVILPIPMLALDALSLFGRHGKDSSEQRPIKSRAWTYRLGGVVMLLVTLKLAGIF